jgi:hypothetical protein
MSTRELSAAGRSLQICLLLLTLVIALNAIAIESALARHKQARPTSIVAADRFGIAATSVPDRFRCEYTAAPVHDYRCSDGVFSQTLAERDDAPGLLVPNAGIPEGKTVQVRELNSFRCSFTGGPARVPGAYSCRYWDNAAQRMRSFMLSDAVYMTEDETPGTPAYVYVEPCRSRGCPAQ